jgi:hypothetical protein
MSEGSSVEKSVKVFLVTTACYTSAVSVPDAQFHVQTSYRHNWNGHIVKHTSNTREINIKMYLQEIACEEIY